MLLCRVDMKSKVQYNHSILELILMSDLPYLQITKFFDANCKYGRSRKYFQQKKKKLETIKSKLTNRPTIKT